MEYFEITPVEETSATWTPMKPKKSAPAPPPAAASDMQALADAMKKRLTSVNISTERAVFPHVEFPSDFGDCELSFSDTKQAEVKLKCVVEKGYESVARLQNLVKKVRDALEGECTVGGYALRTRRLKEDAHSGAGKRCSTLVISVIIR